MRTEVAGALRNKGLTLEELDRNEDAISAYDELLDRFGDDEEESVQEHVE